MVVFEVFSLCKTIFKFDINITNIASIDITLCLYYNIWKCFYLLYGLEEPEVVARMSSVRKVFLSFRQNSQENTCVGLSFAFCNKAAGWRSITSFNTESGRGAFLSTLREL